MAGQADARTVCHAAAGGDRAAGIQPAVHGALYGRMLQPTLRMSAGLQNIPSGVITRLDEGQPWRGLLQGPLELRQCLTVLLQQSEQCPLKQAALYSTSRWSVARRQPGPSPHASIRARALLPAALQQMRTPFVSSPGKAARHLPVRRLRLAALQLRRQVRRRHRLAQLLPGDAHACPCCCTCTRVHPGPIPSHPAGSAVPPLCPPDSELIRLHVRVQALPGATMETNDFSAGMRRTEVRRDCSVSASQPQRTHPRLNDAQPLGPAVPAITGQK